MDIGERIAAQTPAPGPRNIGWFAARQPAVVRLLEDRLRGRGTCASWEALALALDAAQHLAAIFEHQYGVPVPRIGRSLLARAERAVEREVAAVTHAPAAAGARAPGSAGVHAPAAAGVHAPVAATDRPAVSCAARQPALIEWIVHRVNEPTVPLAPAEVRAVGQALTAILYAFDQAVTGRIIL